MRSNFNLVVISIFFLLMVATPTFASATVKIETIECLKGEEVQRFHFTASKPNIPITCSRIIGKSGEFLGDSKDVHKEGDTTAEDCWRRIALLQMTENYRCKQLGNSSMELIQ